MKQFFLILSFITVSIVGSDHNRNQNGNYTISDFKEGFFGGKALFSVKQNEIKQNGLNSFNKVSPLSIKKNKNFIELEIERFQIPLPHSIVPISNNVQGESVILSPTNNDSQVRMHYGFTPIEVTTRKCFLEKLLKKFEIQETVTCFYSLEEDQHHVSWHIKGTDVGSIPIIMEHRHKGRCPKSKAAILMCEEYMK